MTEEQREKKIHDNLEKAMKARDKEAFQAGLKELAEIHKKKKKEAR